MKELELIFEGETVPRVNITDPIFTLGTKQDAVCTKHLSQEHRLEKTQNYISARQEFFTNNLSRGMKVARNSAGRKKEGPNEASKNDTRKKISHRFAFLNMRPDTTALTPPFREFWRARSRLYRNQNSRVKAHSTKSA